MPNISAGAMHPQSCRAQVIQHHLRTTDDIGIAGESGSGEKSSRRRTGGAAEAIPTVRSSSRDVDRHAREQQGQEVRPGRERSVPRETVRFHIIAFRRTSRYASLCPDLRGPEAACPNK